MEEEVLVVAPEFNVVAGAPSAFNNYNSCESYQTAYAVAAAQEMYKRGEITEQELVHLLKSHAHIQSLHDEHLDPDVAVSSAECSGRGSAATATMVV
jgi:hypothetical protein